MGLRPVLVTFSIISSISLLGIDESLTHHEVNKEADHAECTYRDPRIEEEPIIECNLRSRSGPGSSDLTLQDGLLELSILSLKVLVWSCRQGSLHRDDAPHPAHGTTDTDGDAGHHLEQHHTRRRNNEQDNTAYLVTTYCHVLEGVCEWLLPCKKGRLSYSIERGIDEDEKGRDPDGQRCLEEDLQILHIEMIEPLREPSLRIASGRAVDEEGVVRWVMDRRVAGSALLLPRRLATW